MTRRRRATEDGLDPHWKVRVVIPNALLHLAARDEPIWVVDDNGRRELVADWISDPEYGDTIGFIDWSAVTAVTWRWSE